MPLSNDELKRLFSARLSQLMSEKGINQVEFSKIIGVSESTVGKWLLCKSIPRMGIIQKIADYFHVGKSYLLENEPIQGGYYTDPDVAKLANEIKNDPDLRILLDAKRSLSKDDMNSIINITKSLLQKERGE